MLELDNIKDLWGKDKGEDVPEISLEKQKQIHSPLEMMRINMKTEFLVTILSLPYSLMNFQLESKDGNIRVISIFLSIIMIAIIGYFFQRLHKVYKVLQKKDVNTNYELFNMKSQLLMLREIYKSYYVTYVPILFMIYLLPLGFHFEMHYSLTVFAITFLIAIGLLAIVVNFWFKYMYGKYINEVLYLVDELNGVESKVKLTTKTMWFERLQNYLVARFGLVGNILNICIWFALGTCLLIIILTIVFLVLLFTASKLNLINIHEFLKAMEVFANIK